MNEGATLAGSLWLALGDEEPITTGLTLAQKKKVWKADAWQSAESREYLAEVRRESRLRAAARRRGLVLHKKRNVLAGYSPFYLVEPNRAVLLEMVDLTTVEAALLEMAEVGKAVAS